MKYRIVTVGMCVALAISLSGCSTGGSSQPQEESTEAPSSTTEEVESIYGEPVSFAECNLLDIELMSVDTGNSMPSCRYEIQNSSDLLTISNVVLEYQPYDSDGNPLDNELDEDNKVLPIELGPRERVRTLLTSMVDEKEAAGATNIIIRYSYDANGKRYTVDTDTDVAYEDDIEDNSNVDFEEKNIVAFEKSALLGYRSKVCNNKGDLPISTLKVTFAVYDEDNIVDRITLVDAIKAGDKRLKSGEGRVAEIAELDSGGRNGCIKPVCYTYEVAKADNDGYNCFEINLITKEAIGSTNSLLLDNAAAKKVSAKREIAKYTKAFGKKISSTKFKIDKTETTGGGIDYLHFSPDTTFLGLPGDLMLTRDYDTLIIDGLRFVCSDESDSANNQILKALEKGFGTRYESDYEGKELEEASWNLKRFNIHFFPEYHIVTILADSWDD